MKKKVIKNPYPEIHFYCDRCNTYIDKIVENPLIEYKTEQEPRLFQYKLTFRQFIPSLNNKELRLSKHYCAKCKQEVLDEINNLVEQAKRIGFR